MTQLESRIEEIKAMGSQLAFIAAEKRQGVWKPGRFLEKHPIASAFLLDEDRTVSRAYGLHHAFGSDAINIAHPATLVIDRDRSVRYIYRGDNQHDRAPIDEVIEVLQETRFCRKHEIESGGE
jgi:peroxiredoxin